MSNSRIHVVVGTGQVGATLAALLVEQEKEVRVVSLHHTSTTLEGVDSRVVDVNDPEATLSVMMDAAVIYQCLNAPYTQWPKKFPPLQRTVLAAAEATGALLVSLENLYGYGPTHGIPMTESTPLKATSTKGQARAAMTKELLTASEAGRVRIAIGRASDFFGPGVRTSTMGSQVFANALDGKRVNFLGKLDVAHTYSYVPDIAAGLAVLGDDVRAIGNVWHLPGPVTLTTREVFARIGGEVGHEIRVRSVSKGLLQTVGLVSPMMRGLAEMAYEFEEPFVMDTTKFVTSFGYEGTNMDVAIKETVGWYREHRGVS